MKELNKVILINPTFSEVDWHLYDLPASEQAALDLNRALRKIYNAGASRDDVQAEMTKVMDRLNLVGANDAGAKTFLSQILDHLYEDSDDNNLGWYASKGV